MKNLYWLVICIGLCISLFSCEKKKVRTERFSEDTLLFPVNYLKKEILTKGDVQAYDALCISYFGRGHLDEHLVYSMYMANKYKYPKAYYMVARSIILMFEKNRIPIDMELKKIALDYLKRGVELKDRNAMDYYGELLMEGRYVPKDSVLGKKLYEESWK